MLLGIDLVLGRDSLPGRRLYRLLCPSLNTHIKKPWGTHGREHVLWGSEREHAEAVRRLVREDTTDREGYCG